MVYATPIVPGGPVVNSVSVPIANHRDAVAPVGVSGFLDAALDSGACKVHAVLPVCRGQIKAIENHDFVQRSPPDQQLRHSVAGDVTRGYVVHAFTPDSRVVRGAPDACFRYLGTAVDEEYRVVVSQLLREEGRVREAVEVEVYVGGGAGIREAVAIGFSVPKDIRRVGEVLVHAPPARRAPHQRGGAVFVVGEQPQVRVAVSIDVPGGVRGAELAAPVAMPPGRRRLVTGHAKRHGLTPGHVVKAAVASGCRRFGEAGSAQHDVGSAVAVEIADEPAEGLVVVRIPIPRPVRNHSQVLGLAARPVAIGRPVTIPIHPVTPLLGVGVDRGVRVDAVGAAICCVGVAVIIRVRCVYRGFFSGVVGAFGILEVGIPGRRGVPGRGARVAARLGFGASAAGECGEDGYHDTLVVCTPLPLLT